VRESSKHRENEAALIYALLICPTDNEYVSAVENKIYPKVMRVTYEVTNEYGTRYFRALDEEKGEWTTHLKSITYPVKQLLCRIPSVKTIHT